MQKAYKKHKTLLPFTTTVTTPLLHCYSYYTLLSVAPLYKIFPSSIHTFANPCFIPDFFRSSVGFRVKLSVILTLNILAFFLLEKTFFLTLYVLSFTIIGLGLFWPGFFFPNLCIRSRSAGEMSMFIFVNIVLITKSSVISSSVSTIP